jgi:tRNA-dihydrouridine synthase B
MSGISDLAFRLLNRKYGCELAFVEMLNVRSLGYNSHKTEEMLSTNKNDRPLGVQILGSEPEFILRALDILKNYKYDILDFNAACPVKKVTRRGEGASLLKNPAKLQNLLKLVVKNSGVPVTVKIRTGWDKNSINAKEVAFYAQDSGISALFIHGRTKLQGHSGKVDYQIIKEVKKALDIPVIASGDVLSAELARKMFDETGCDGLLIARGALGNPWIFKQMNTLLKNKNTLKLAEPDEIADTMLEHLSSCIDFYGSRNAVTVFHKFFGWYTRGFRKIRRLREKAYRTKTKEEIFAVIEDFRGYERVGARLR